FGDAGASVSGAGGHLRSEMGSVREDAQANHLNVTLVNLGWPTPSLAWPQRSRSLPRRACSVLPLTDAAEAYEKTGPDRCELRGVPAHLYRLRRGHPILCSW